MGKIFTSLGLMSGTSGDGVDASLISSDGLNKYNIIFNQYFKFDQKTYEKVHILKDKITKFEDLKKYNNEINELEREITLFHSKVVSAIISFTNEKIDLMLTLEFLVSFLTFTEILNIGTFFILENK